MPIPNFVDPEDPDVFEEEYVMRYGLEHPLTNPLERLVGSLKWLLADLEETGEGRDEMELQYMSVANAYAALKEWEQATSPMLGKNGMNPEPFMEQNMIPGWRFTIDGPEAKGIVELLESGYGLRVRFPEYHSDPVALIDLFYRSPESDDGTPDQPFSIVLDDPLRVDTDEPLEAARWTQKDGLRVAILGEQDIDYKLTDPAFPGYATAFGYTTPIGEDAP